MEIRLSIGREECNLTSMKSGTWLSLFWNLDTENVDARYHFGKDVDQVTGVGASGNDGGNSFFGGEYLLLGVHGYDTE